MKPTVQQGLVYLRSAEQEVQQLYVIAYDLARTGELTVEVATLIEEQARRVYEADVQMYQFLYGFVGSLPGGSVLAEQIPVPQQPEPIVPLAERVEETGAKAAPVLAIPVLWVVLLLALAGVIISLSIMWTIEAVRDMYAIAADTTRFRLCLLAAVKASRKQGEEQGQPAPLTAEAIQACGASVRETSSAPEPKPPPPPVDWNRIALYGVGGLVSLGGFYLLLSFADRRLGSGGGRRRSVEMQPYNRYER